MPKFSVGDRYATRKGEYEVIGVEGDSVVIRYGDGSVQRDSVAFLRRVWDNLGSERRPPTVKGGTGPGPCPGKVDLGRNWLGLASTDFRNNVAGTHWRCREQLGGALSVGLTALAGKEFESQSIYNWPEVHVAMPERYNLSLKVRQAKFVFRLDEQTARYAFYVEKSREQMDESWDWLRFRQAVGDSQQQRWLTEALLQTGLTFEAQTWEGDQAVTLLRFGASAKGLIQTQPVEALTGWEAVLASLDAVPASTWCDVYIGAQLAKDEAVQLGTSVAGQAVKAYGALVPLYERISRSVVPNAHAREGA